MEKVKKFDEWAFHTLNKKQKQKRLKTCFMFLSSHKFGSVLSQIIISEIWIQYDNRTPLAQSQDKNESPIHNPKRCIR